MIKYYDGRIDNRPTLRTNVSGGFVYAVQMNPDGSTESICYDDLEYGREVRQADVCIDANEFDHDIHERYLAYNRIGKNGIWAEVGDIVKVVRGRKYPKDSQFAISNIKSYSIPGTYGHKILTYLYDNDGNYKIDASNVEIIDNERIKFCREHGNKY